MIRQHGFAVLSLGALLAYGGCATVNPRPDYDRIAKYVSEATGRRAATDQGRKRS